jgi:murein DD-endopeptidase MepM/ murein hydrolase activator NlpD
VPGKAHLGADSSGVGLQQRGLPVYAIASGTVRLKGSGWPGYALGIEHKTGSGARFIGVYGHINTTIVIGASVAKGQRLGTILDQGSNSHLHLGVRPLATGESGSTAPLRGSSPCVNGSANSYGYADPIPWLTSHPATPATSALQPITGDWNGDGKTDIGLRRISNGTFYLRTGPSWAQSTVAWATGVGSDLQPITGDWNGDGKTDIGLRRISNGTFYLRTGPSWAQSTVAWATGAG